MEWEVGARRCKLLYIGWITRPYCVSQKTIQYPIINSMEKAMAPHSSTLAWKIPWAEEPGRLQSMGSRRVGHD